MIVADSISSSFCFPVLGDVGRVKKDFDHAARSLGFLTFAFKGDGTVGGGSKKGRPDGAGEVGRRDGEGKERER